ncbi:DUF3857 and transglutaminase domain-containing protein [Pseudoduganella ginsengisoli]|uniref:DUF3857 domain-containing protein n=1 Tax=Pseudoduganella ginsengisoli TaxID=1462440 RepID=A0A6L6Q4S5_9BURK|nr:DUF3857 and transglutaminase domain-containing protein [Pseudoduganella ginsengisoli]MTW04863.1 DUF3857 domain-containing protein [Pseudoduganella ginsengisoli]
MLKIAKKTDLKLKSWLGILLFMPLSCVFAEDKKAETTLYRDNVTYVLQRDGRFDMVRELLWQINTTAAISKNREQTIVFDVKNEKAEVLEAYIERPDGRRHRISASAAWVSKLPNSEDIIRFRDKRNFHVPFKNIHVGDRIYSRVRTTTIGKPALEGNFFGTWLAYTPEVAPAEFSVTIDRPQDMPLYSEARGFRQVPRSASPGRTVSSWQFDGGVNSYMEMGSANRTAYRDLLHVSTFENYAAVARLYEEHASKQIKFDAQVANLARTIVAGLNDPRSKALAIHTWIRKHIRYRAIYFDSNSMLPSYASGTILRHRSGDCKDHAILMQAMLDAVGIESTSVLINWGDDIYTLPHVASMHFGHVISYIPALDLYLDATSKDIEGGYLPVDQLDKPTLLTRSGEIGHTPARQDGQINKQFDVRILSDGSATFNYYVNNSGYWGESRRAVVRDTPQSRPGSWLQFILQQRGWSGSAQEYFDAPQAYNGDFHFRYTDGKVKPFLPKDGQAAIDASSALWEDIRILVQGYAVDATRVQPFRCLQSNIVERANYKLPGSIEVVALPDDLSIENDYFQYRAHYERTATGLIIERHLRSEQAGKRLCTPEEFAQVADAVASMAKDVSSKIVLQINKKQVNGWCPST